MQEVDSQALQLVARALRLSTGGSQLTQFQDELLQQSIDVGAVVRRGLTLAGTEGIHGASITNTHAAAGNETTTIAPFNLDGLQNAPFPAEIPTFFDFWVLWACPVTLSGAGVFNGMDASILTPAANEAFGGTGSTAARFGLWSDEITFTGIGSFPVSATGAGDAAWTNPQRVGMRVPRGGTLRIRTRAEGAAVYRLDLIVGLFPIGMGQDVLV